MAVKAKTTAEATQEEAVVNSTAETEKVENGADNEATEATEERVKVAYIGPTLPAGRLKCNKIFEGTMTEIKKELGEVLKDYPLVEKLLVPVDKLGEKKDKAKTPGNILNKYCSDINSLMAARGYK